MIHSKKRKPTVYSPIAFLVVLLTLFSLTVVYDSNHIISTLSSLVLRRRMEPPTTPSPVSVQLALPKREEMHKTRVAICALSKSKPTWQYVHDSSVYKLFLTGIYQTTHMQSQYDITVHVGVDTDDVFWSKKDNYNALVLASARDFNLKLTVYHYAKKQPNHLPMNELMRDAARTGAEYLVRLNDDTQIKSMSWLPLAVHQLSAYDPPNVGVVGPVCREGKTSILTHDMVHRTHLEIFDTYYPPNFHNWYVDDWISAVYGPERTTKIPDWVVHHYVSPPRYNPIMVSNETLQKSIQEGKDRIQAYLSRRNVSRKLSQVTLRVGHPRGGIGWQGKDSEKIRAYCKRDKQSSSYIQELIYPKDSYLDIGSWNDPSYDNTWRYLLSLHNPKIDSVVSKGILNWLFATPGTYPSTTEVHTLCTAPIDGQPLINCESGKIAIEIGSAVGMVSAYLARRGMRVFAVDPVLPNIERLEETRCMNGMRQCLEQNEDIDCHNHSNWGQFTPDNFGILHAAGGDKTNLQTKISSLAKNMAATNLKLGGSLGSKGEMWSGLVSTVTVDDIISKINAHIDVLHISAQESEWSVLQGTSHLISTGMVQNIIFMLYQNDASAQQQIAQSLKIKSFLQGFGYQFYDLDGCGRGENGVATGPPILLNEEEVVKYIEKKRYNGWHTMLLASKAKKLSQMSALATKDQDTDQKTTDVKVVILSNKHTCQRTLVFLSSLYFHFGNSDILDVVNVYDDDCVIQSSSSNLKIVNVHANTMLTSVNRILSPQGVHLETTHYSGGILFAKLGILLNFPDYTYFDSDTIFISDEMRHILKGKKNILQRIQPRLTELSTYYVSSVFRLSLDSDFHSFLSGIGTILESKCYAPQCIRHNGKYFKLSDGDQYIINLFVIVTKVPIHVQAFQIGVIGTTLVNEYRNLNEMGVLHFYQSKYNIVNGNTGDNYIANRYWQKYQKLYLSLIHI